MSLFVLRGFAKYFGYGNIAFFLRGVGKRVILCPGGCFGADGFPQVFLGFGAFKFFIG